MEDEEPYIKSSDEIDVSEEWEVFTRHLVDQICERIIERDENPNAFGNTIFTIAGSLMSNAIRLVDPAIRKKVLHQFMDIILTNLEKHERADKQNL